MVSRSPSEPPVRHDGAQEAPAGERDGRAVSLLMVAKEAGVSRATASLVLRESPLVAAATRQKVVEAMERLGYIYNRGAANLRQSRTGTIGLVLGNIGSPFFSELMAGVDEANDARGIVCLVANSHESPERQLRQLRRLREHNVDGVIVCPAMGSDGALLTELRRLDLPFVQALRFVSPDETGRAGGDYVGADYASGIESAVRHLVALGKRRIMFVGATELHSAARARLEGFRRAIHLHGLPAGLIVPGESMGTYDVAAFENMIGPQGDEPDAAICYSDVVALDVMNRLQAQGRRPGVDFAVIGMDDLPQAAGAYPALTTIATGPREVGRMAAHLLHDRIARRDAPYAYQVLPPRMVIRASCGECGDRHAAP